MSGFFEIEPIPFQSLKSGASYRLVRADRVEADDRAIRNVLRICNESRVYETLFRPLFLGEPYPRAKAQSFLTWAHRGWAERTHFVYLVLDFQGDVQATIDLKSSALDRVETGYWSSADHPGVMTPACAALLGVAARAGFRSIFAHVMPENTRSIAVLTRNGFQREPGQVQHKGKTCEIYSRSLLND